MADAVIPFSLKQCRLGLRNSTTRIPFRYGNTCLERCPQALMQVTIETPTGVHRGYSADCLPPGWFDKSAGRTFAQQIDDMLAVTRMAERAFGDAARRPISLFDAWLEAYQQVHALARQRGLGPLLASFGVSLVERAVMDALARAAGLSFANAVRQNVYGVQPQSVHSRLAGLEPRDWLPPEPARKIYVRHTVGLSDPLTAADVSPEDRVDDGLPQTLEEYLDRTGVAYFKIKVSNNLEHDRARLVRLAALVESRRGDSYRVTLDGNEQYKSATDFDRLVEVLQSTPELRTLLTNTLSVEQPLDRTIALDGRHTDGIRRLSATKPVIIDESDGELTSFAEAVELGYRGTSCKNCKGPIKAILNAGLVWLLNGRRRSGDYVITGEDLCCVGMVSVQADTCLVATLGLEHVERNGHHYHRGLSYLPPADRAAALAAHGDFYTQTDDVVTPHVRGGMFQIGSLQCVGFGFAVEPDPESFQPADTWQFDSLGIP